MLLLGGNWKKRAEKKVSKVSAWQCGKQVLPPVCHTHTGIYTYRPHTHTHTLGQEAKHRPAATKHTRQAEMTPTSACSGLAWAGLAWRCLHFHCLTKVKTRCQQPQTLPDVLLLLLLLWLLGKAKRKWMPHDADRKIWAWLSLEMNTQTHKHKQRSPQKRRKRQKIKVKRDAAYENVLALCFFTFPSRILPWLNCCCPACVCLCVYDCVCLCALYKSALLTLFEFSVFAEPFWHPADKSAKWVCYNTVKARVSLLYTFSIEVVGLQPKQVEFSIIVTRSFILLRKKKEKNRFEIYLSLI